VRSLPSLACVPSVLSCVLVLAAPAHAARFVLADGKTVDAVVIDETEAGWRVMTMTGERTLDRAQVTSVDLAAPVTPQLQAKADREAARAHERRVVAGKELVKRWPLAKTDEARAELALRLDALTPEVAREVYADALESEREVVRDLALDRLVKLGAPAAEPLARAAITGKLEAQRVRAQAAAVELDREKARATFELAASTSTKASWQLRAIDALGALGDKRSTPALVAALDRVQVVFRAQLARAKDLKNVPVNLGTTGGAATSVPIELPEMELIEIATGAAVPAAAFELLQARAEGALKKVSGQALGRDVAAWRGWWEQQPEAAAIAPPGR
jgi:hypothetical protein